MSLQYVQQTSSVSKAAAPLGVLRVFRGYRPLLLVVAASALRKSAFGVAEVSSPGEHPGNKRESADL